MHLTKEQLTDLSKKRSCPRCDLDKTVGNALCRRCRANCRRTCAWPWKHPRQRRRSGGNALRAAANYFTVHFASVRKFGGGRKSSPYCLPPAVSLAALASSRAVSSGSAGQFLGALATSARAHCTFERFAPDCAKGG